jgi:hypothetical protein
VIDGHCLLTDVGARLEPARGDAIHIRSMLLQRTTT